MTDQTGQGTDVAAAEPGPPPADEPVHPPGHDETDDQRPVDLRLARVHLRMGSLALARAELEILAGREALDRPGQVDLAEARWRSGDLAGAGIAASIAMGAGDEPPIVLAIAAEAASALGRPNEARRLANRAMERLAGPIDELFAGMPRSGVWPADLAEPAPTAGTLFHHEPVPGPIRRAGDAEVDVVAMRANPRGDTQESGGSALTLGFWEPDGSDDALGPGQPDPGSEVEAARAALIDGALDDATLRFGLALRLAPALAPAVLEATDGVSTPAMNVVRGDAYRLVGLETEARRAYAAAAWSGARDRRHHAERQAATGDRPGDAPVALETDEPETDELETDEPETVEDGQLPMDVEADPHPGV
jgi:hypothetical protein